MTNTKSGKITTCKHGVTLNFMYAYFIAWDRIASEKSLLKWVFHLLEKNWIDTDAIHELITIVSKHHNLDVYGE